MDIVKICHHAVSLLDPKRFYQGHIASTHQALSERVDAMVYQVYKCCSLLEFIKLTYMGIQITSVHGNEIRVVLKMKAFADHILQGHGSISRLEL